ncbi:TolC family protein [Pseudobacteriovorax antillogorgiicola]|uniref:Outer membrane protein TolC n=1 Tax=Pseudobacteriovorax antillogorgiicola TaxID=1513793 RepID=A0A1Y6BFZ4_9BACT|nr:TolC family protein [Pseudobacteriovorax antillogorgiicola]TCS56255.1 outer membrane protein TolC [Pseudobacteriovorax antillogorgiicola]SMF07944.1 Outer membrane protein TolC [Pseudobacteriovorax antillogorgiicola]
MLADLQVDRWMRLCLILLLWPCVLWGAPSKEQKFLAMVPGGVVTLDAIVDLGYRYSDQVQILKAELETKEVPYIKASQATDGQLSASLTHLSDKNELANPQGFQIESRQQLDFSWSRSFESGTQLSTSLLSTRQDLIFSQPFPLDDYESQVTLSVKQSLWRNSLGQTFKDQLAAAKFHEKAVEFQYSASLGEWFQGLQEIYHQAWMAQNSVRFAKERIQTQKRLLKITKLLFNRGTAEKADVLNIEQNLLQVEQAYRQAQKSLSDIWRKLVILLKLPDEFLNVDPEKIPLEESSFESQIKALCSNTGLEKARSDYHPDVATLLERIKSQELKVKTSADQFDPDLYVQAAIGGNSVDNDLGTTYVDSLSFKDPNYSVVVGIDVTLGQSAAKAEMLESKKNLKVSRMQLASKRSEIKIDWTNTCQEVKRLQADRSSYRRMLKMNRERKKLEEERFTLGKVDVQTVILSANDVIISQESLARTEASLIGAIWKLKKMHGDVPKYIAAAVKNSKIR